MTGTEIYLWVLIGINWIAMGTLICTYFIARKGDRLTDELYQKARELYFESQKARDMYFEALTDLQKRMKEHRNDIQNS